jgi:mRNA interferase MazF
MVEEVRPGLVVSAAYGDLDRALITVVPHTTSLRWSEFEIVVPLAFLKPGAFLVQNVATYPVVRAIRKLGVLNKEQFDHVGTGPIRFRQRVAALQIPAMAVRRELPSKN